MKNKAFQSKIKLFSSIIEELMIFSHNHVDKTMAWPFDLHPPFDLDPSVQGCPRSDAHTHSAPLSPPCASLLPAWEISGYGHTVIKNKTGKISMSSKTKSKRIKVKNKACEIA